MSNRDITEVEEPRGGDERAFKAKHKVQVTDHPEGTKLPPITTSKKKRLADPVDTEATYEEVEHIDEISDPLKRKYLDAAIADHEKRWSEPAGPEHLTKTGRLKKSWLNSPERKKRQDKLQSRRNWIQKTSKSVTGQKHLSDWDGQPYNAGKIQKYSTEEVETTFSIFWRDANGMDKQKHGLSEEEVTKLASILEASGSIKIYIDEEVDDDDFFKPHQKSAMNNAKRLYTSGHLAKPGHTVGQPFLSGNKHVVVPVKNSGGQITHHYHEYDHKDGYVPPQASMSKPSSLFTEMTDTQMKKREKYVKSMKSKDDDLRKRYGKRWKDVMYAIATKNAMREEAESLDEIAKSEEEPLHVQLRKRTNANEVSLTFKNGKTHTVSRGDANKAITMLSGLRPADRQHAHAEMSKSHTHFMDALAGKIAKPGKTGISLAGPKMKNEEVESLDESNYRKAVHAAFNGDEDAFHKHMGVTDDMQKSHPTYQNSKRKYKQLKSMSDNTSIGDAVKLLQKEEVVQVDELKKTALMAVRNRASGRMMDNPSNEKAYNVEKQASKRLKKITDAEKEEESKRAYKAYREEVESLDETHRVGVTYSDPNSSSVAMRKEKQFKQVKVKAASEDEAITKAKKHFKNSGYKVHDATITTMKEEIESLDELDRNQGGILNRYTQRTKDNPKRKKGRDLALLKRWGDKNFGLPEPKVKAVQREDVESLDEVGGQTSTSAINHPPSRPAPKAPAKKAATPAANNTVSEAGNIIPPNTPKMKSFSEVPNNFKLDKPRAKSFNVPTQKDRALEMDE